MCQSRTISIIILLSFQWRTARQCNWSPHVHPLHKRHFWSFRPCHHYQALCRWLKDLYRHIIPLRYHLLPTPPQSYPLMVAHLAIKHCFLQMQHYATWRSHFAPHHLPPLHIADQLLASTTLLTDLGIKFDNYLKFNDHIQDIVPKPCLQTLKPNFPLLSFQRYQLTCKSLQNLCTSTPRI